LSITATASTRWRFRELYCHSRTYPKFTPQYLFRDHTKLLGNIIEDIKVID